MRVADIRFLFGYDRWATRRILAVIDGVDAATWGAPGVVGDRGLGAILVHQLGAHQRWRLGPVAADAEAADARNGSHSRRPRRLARRLGRGMGRPRGVARRHRRRLARRRLDDGVPFWQMLAHVVNHGTQHRSEAAALLTAAGGHPATST